MTPEQKSKQASQNANASRLKWQRAAIANGNLANEYAARIADLEWRNKDLAQRVVAQTDVASIRMHAIDRLNLACRQAESEADIWRTKAHDYEDADVQRQASAIAKGGAA